MVEIVEKYLSIFFIYSFLGWTMETIGGLIIKKKLVNRGFLIGPYCPVYGIGVCLLTAFLSGYVKDIPIMFFMSMLICGTLEYFTSYIMEKTFKARWWDYSNKRFNINGRICLETLIPFGIAGVILVRFLNPSFLQILNFIALKYILIFICVLFIIDFIFSFKGILGFRKTTKQVETEVKDDTEEISNQMKELAQEKYEELKGVAKGKATTINRNAIEKIDKLRQGASEKIIDAKEDLHDMRRKINVSYKKAKMNVKFKGHKLYTNLMVSKEKIKERTINKLLKEKLREKSWLTRRLLKAFPDLKVKLKDDEEGK